MPNVNKLSDSRNFKDFSISHDKTRDQQLQDVNWKTIIIAVGRDKVVMKGFIRDGPTRRNYK